MSMDVDATLGYGILIKDSALISKLCEDQLELKDIFEVKLGGNLIIDNVQCIICIKESMINTSFHDELKTPITLEKLMPRKEWIDELFALANELKISHSNIGWWLVASLS